MGRALARLGIEHIPAYSPQGRSERMFGTLQGRLPKELSLFGIRDIEAANRCIREVYLPLHNDQFAVPPQIPESAFVAVDPASLVDVLCIEPDRVVARDNTVTYQGRLPCFTTRDAWRATAHRGTRSRRSRPPQA